MVDGNASKRQRLRTLPADLAAMEVRSMETVRRMLRRTAEALQLLRLIGQHHPARLAQTLDAATRAQLCQLSLHQLVCSAAGDHVATKMVAALMQVGGRVGYPGVMV